MNPLLLAGLISALVAVASTLATIPVRHAVDKRFLRYRLATEYEYDQRKRLREVVGRHLGRLTESAERLNYRIWNLYLNEGRGWLDTGGDYGNTGYYFYTSVFRFVELCALMRLFENEAITLDPRIAEKKDMAFVRYVKALLWVLTDVELYAGLEYDDSTATDHFFIDQLRLMCDNCCEGSTPPALRDFPKRMSEDDSIKVVAMFFDGLRRGESRLRWDRIVAFDLLLMAFLNEYGDQRKGSSPEKFAEAMRNIRNPKVIVNLVRWLPLLGLDELSGTRLIVNASTKLRQSAQASP